MAERDLFITGMARSGTTLVEKILANHPRLSVLSQPFPALFLHAKRLFFAHLGVDAPEHLLGPMLGDPADRTDALTAFLDGLRLPTEALRAVFESMRAYSGQWTTVDDAEALVADLGGRRFPDAIRGLDRRMSGRTDALGYGSKEIRCEEFLPHLLAEGFHCVLVVRDPRDVIASMHCGRGETFVGAPRPLLFDLRMWRKSIAFALHLEAHPRLHVLRYEDVVGGPGMAAARLTDWLGLDPHPEAALRGDLRDQSGAPWRGNSSHGERSAISTDSVGAHATRLDEEQIRYIESACFPEMRCLGYETRIGAPDASVFCGYRERGVTRGDDVSPDYSSAADNIVAERARLEAWQQDGMPDDVLARHFLFADVARALRDARRAGPMSPGRSADGATG